MLTPFQTVGPFLSLGLRVGLDIGPATEAGRRIVIRGRLLDGSGQGIPDGVLEWWHHSFDAVHRALTEDDGHFVVETLKPSGVTGAEGSTQAPHIAVRVLGRGILTQYLTRVYFADEVAANAADNILTLVPADRRGTLIASPVAANAYRFDVVVQGENETVFFDF
jgi:protocatechuate 3,4-dioxygenase alpha subunit